ncbi:MAG: FAD-binding oxidoreductase, partial [Gammaproteobacteria bacterium]|nr:FAD-binding oxidoreductase [Gammaproteobacteria bacterium]
DWTSAYQPDPLAVVLPRDTDQVIALVKLANEIGFALVPSGGRTGLSGGAVACNREVVVAFDRMNQILDFNPVDRQVVCQPGVITEQLQQFAEQQGLFYPVDFASSGSSQIGGNVATNAGGIKVIRYGMTRQWVMGLKVVTGSGELLDLNRGLVKNATGYDFRQLFIGSEGTLGLIVEVSLALASPPEDPTVLLLAVSDMAASMEVLKLFQQRLTLSAFEFFSEQALQHVVDEKGLQRPFETRSPFYVLIEFENNSDAKLDEAMALFESCVESGWVLDGTISQSAGQAQSLWRLREDISETISRFTPYKNDISVKVSQVPEFLAQVDQLVSDRYPDFEIIWFGHIGDGNVHLNILKPTELDLQEFQSRCAIVSEEVFQLVNDYGGSISAEHGVGLLKKPFLKASRAPAEIACMQSVKKVFDPRGVLNPGKIFEP